MIINMHPVTVHELPGQMTVKEAQNFMQNVRACIETERPHLVLDCSRLRRIDRTALQLLFNCLEEAMKLNGDVKLAGLHPEVRATLWLAGARRLFETFPTAAEAVRSFHHRPAAIAPWEENVPEFGLGT
jgi:anti-anti-sigma factor